jgi:hypothetical protein
LLVLLAALAWLVLTALLAATLLILLAALLVLLAALVLIRIIHFRRSWLSLVLRVNALKTLPVPESVGDI